MGVTLPDGRIKEANTPQSAPGASDRRAAKKTVNKKATIFLLTCSAI